MAAAAAAWVVCVAVASRGWVSVWLMLVMNRSVVFQCVWLLLVEHESLCVAVAKRAWVGVCGFCSSCMEVCVLLLVLGGAMCFC